MIETSYDVTVEVTDTDFGHVVEIDLDVVLPQRGVVAYTAVRVRAAGRTGRPVSMSPDSPRGMALLALYRQHVEMTLLGEGFDA